MSKEGQDGGPGGLGGGSAQWRPDGLERVSKEGEAALRESQRSGGQAATWPKGDQAQAALLGSEAANSTFLFGDFGRSG